PGVRRCRGARDQRAGPGVGPCLCRPGASPVPARGRAAVPPPPDRTRAPRHEPAPAGPGRRGRVGSTDVHERGARELTRGARELTRGARELTIRPRARYFGQPPGDSHTIVPISVW